VTAAVGRDSQNVEKIIIFLFAVAWKIEVTNNI
jgi:hypothetical protein